MKLEIAEFPVKQILLSYRFSYHNQVLEIDESEIVALVREDARVEDVSLAVVVPGEKTRITGIRDIVEPRCKVHPNIELYAGIWGWSTKLPTNPTGEFDLYGHPPDNRSGRVRFRLHVLLVSA